MELSSLKSSADDNNHESSDALSNARDMTPTQTTDKPYHVSNRPVVPQLQGTAVPKGISAEELVSYKPEEWMQAASGFEVHDPHQDTTSSSNDDGGAAALRRRSLQAGGVARLRRRRHRASVPEQPAAADEPKLEQLFQLGSGGWLTLTPTGTAAASLPTGTPSESDHHHDLDSELKKEAKEEEAPHEEMVEVTKTRGRRTIHPKIPVPISALHPSISSDAAGVDHGRLGLSTTWHDHLPVVPPTLTPAVATATAKPESSREQQQKKSSLVDMKAMEDAAAAALRFGQTGSMKDQFVKRDGESWTKPRIPVPVSVSAKDRVAAAADATPTATANREPKKSSGAGGEKYGTGAQAAEGGLHADNSKMMQKGGAAVLGDGRVSRFSLVIPFPFSPFVSSSPPFFLYLTSFFFFFALSSLCNCLPLLTRTKEEVSTNRCATNRPTTPLTTIKTTSTAPTISTTTTTTLFAVVIVTSSTMVGLHLHHHHHHHKGKVAPAVAAQAQAAASGWEIHHEVVASTLSEVRAVTLQLLLLPLLVAQR